MTKRPNVLLIMGDQMDADPCESANLIEDPARVECIAELRAHLVEELDGREEGYVQNSELAAGRTPAVYLGKPCS